MNVVNMGLGVVTNKLEIKFYAMPKPTVSKGQQSLDEEIMSKIKNNNLDISSYKPFNTQALIDEDQFYLDLQNIDDKDEFYFINQGLVNLDLGHAPVIGLEKSDFEALEKRKESIRFLIIEEKDKFKLLYLSPYKNILKNKHGFTIGSKSIKFDIFYGIVYPEYITAILDKNNWRLSVANVINFERMFKLKAVRLAKAKSVFQQFKNGKLTISQDKLKVKFDKAINLDKKQYQKVRQITYISSYDPNGMKYNTSNIKKAMKHLPKDEKLSIENKTIHVDNEKQFKTFAAILHDSILQRMVSGKYEIM
ncbi:Kiwa anti-phage protein KwaB-like domain-containing protein [Paenibacillus barengoltzii]|uniref:Kiwa anti-phage protein KwaB-like domain-containing protein n=1 Tax=Bacilli TaxID=91061 RepID=UPI003F894305